MVGKLAAWFVLDPVVPDSNTKNVKKQKKALISKLAAGDGELREAPAVAGAAIRYAIMLGVVRATLEEVEGEVQTSRCYFLNDRVFMV